METCDPVETLMEIKDKLDLDKNGTLVDATKYRSMIGALMYLTSSRPDIVHATCLCARYQAKPTKKYLKEVKRIFRYLWGTVNMGLWYTKDSGFEVTGFSDADYAGCTVFREPPYPFDYPMRRLTMEEILAKFIDEGRREHEEMEIFIKEFRTTNELLLKTRSNLLSELKIEVNELSNVVSNVLIPKDEVKGVTTSRGKMTSKATRSKEINETRFNKNEPPRFEQDV
ncbi:hypothetical protein Tco_0347849 [Tanacetum coccineum]